MFGDGTDLPRKWASPLFGEGEVRASEPTTVPKEITEFHLIT